MENNFSGKKKKVEYGCTTGWNMVGSLYLQGF